FPDPGTDLWLPTHITPLDRDAVNLTSFKGTMIARLAPGIGPDRLATQARAVLDREIAHFPYPTAISQLNQFGLRIVVTPLRDALVGDLSGRLILAQLATLMLLLLVWFNLANLFIIRALKRRGELTVRRVLGAETGVLFQQLLAESF